MQHTETRCDQLICDYQRENGQCIQEIDELRRKLNAAKKAVEIVSTAQKLQT
jgi:hypothetical protein